MTRISRRFRDLRDRGEKALILYLTAGDPSLEKTLEFIPALEAAGADLLEIGVPFGPDRGRAGHSGRLPAGPAKRNQSGRGPGSDRPTAPAFGDPGGPVQLLQPYLGLWARAVARSAKTSGVDGVLVVDLPLEEAGELRQYTDPQDLDFINLLAPTTGAERGREIAARARGFLYYISIVGLTGTAGPEVTLLQSGVAGIRQVTDLPIVIGFGLSEPEQVREVAPLADGVVVGSALVRMLHDLGGRKDGTKRISDFVYRLKKALGPE